MDSEAFDNVLLAIYRGAIEEVPWSSMLPLLRELFDAKTASLILRPPTEGDEGVILNSLRPGAYESDPSAAIANPDDWQATTYREQFFSLDPFVNLQTDSVITLAELTGKDALSENAYFTQYLQPIGVMHILGVDTIEPTGTIARLRFGRGENEKDFSAAEKNQLKRLLPHIRQALQLQAELLRTNSERQVYAATVEQLSLGTILLDDLAAVVSVNQVAEDILNERDGINRRDDGISLNDTKANAELQRMVASVLAQETASSASVAGALRVRRVSGAPDLGLVVRPIRTGNGLDAASGPQVAIYLSDPQRQAETSYQTLAELFELTPAEARLSMHLARGLSLAEAAEALGVTQNTARAQLKAVFSKTSVTRQAELVSLILKSVATLG